VAEFARQSFADLGGFRPPGSGISRRRFIGSTAGLALGGVLGSALASSSAGGTTSTTTAGASTITEIRAAALEAVGRDRLRTPGSLPNPALPAGTDTMPGIEHIVLLMLENHSFDNIFGVLGRGDGFTIGSNGLPTATNPYADGSLQHAFLMPSVAQLGDTPSQEWQCSNMAYDKGRMDGFVTAPISPGSSPVGAVAMGYFDRSHLPFTYSLASVFPIADRWFCSLLGQTDPNRRYLIAGTSGGMTDDIAESVSLTALQDPLLAEPDPTIFDLLTAYNISWIDYNASFPLGDTAELYPVTDSAIAAVYQKSVDDFFTDAASGSLPAFSFVEPDYNTQSQENPQNVAVGEVFLAQVVNAIGSSPLWDTTLFIFTYDEHGGYYDHVPPPVSLAPDAIPPVVLPGESTYEGFTRYGFRVPGLIVSPYAKAKHVSSVLHDHTSVLALIERKWNLPALTLRDANANDLTDLIDLSALAKGEPTFPALPPLAAPNEAGTTVTSPGVIPPPGTITSP
jgi:phospholipase C